MDLFKPTSMQEQFNSLKGKTSLCVSCPLAITRERVVFGSGKISKPFFAIIGEAPTALDEEKNLPFAGQDGDFLKSILKKLEILEHCYFTNSVLCKTPDLRLPLETERDACFTHLKNQLSLIRPRGILLLGKSAGISFLGTTAFSISDERHKLDRQWRKTPVFLTYYPNVALQKEYRPDLLTTIEADITKFFNHLKK